MNSVFLQNVDVSLGYWGTGRRSCQLSTFWDRLGWAQFCNLPACCEKRAENEAASEQAGIQTHQHDDFIFNPCIGSYHALHQSTLRFASNHEHISKGYDQDPMPLSKDLSSSKVIHIFKKQLKAAAKTNIVLAIAIR